MSRLLAVLLLGVCATVAVSAGAPSYCFTAAGLAKMKQWEGWNANFYQDSAKVWTIGYGTACQPSIKASPVCKNLKAPINQAQGVTLLKNEVQKKVVKCLNTALNGIPKALNNNQYSALVSFLYNLGCGVITGSSSVAKYLKSGDLAKVPTAMKLYNKAKVNGVLKVLPGLINRRAQEVALWNDATSSACAFSL